MTDLQDVVQRKIEDRIGKVPVLLGYLEHQVDLIGTVVVGLSEVVDQTALTDELKARIDELKAILQHSSVDFANLQSPYENYKIPVAISSKKEIRAIQRQYLSKKLEEEGVL